jgi:hypothetical protein
MDNLRSAKDRCHTLWHQKKGRLEQNLQLRLFEQDCDRVSENERTKTKIDVEISVCFFFKSSYAIGSAIVVRFFDRNIPKSVRAVRKQCNYLLNMNNLPKFAL